MAGRWPGLENDWRGRPKEPPNFQRKPYGWWRHFRWKGPTRADIVQLPVAHAHTLPPLRVTIGHYGWRFIMSLPVKKPHYTTYLWYKHLLIDIIFIKLIQLYPLIPDYLVTRKRNIKLNFVLFNTWNYTIFMVRYFNFFLSVKVYIIYIIK